jgi:hypothetical protein
MCIAEREGCSSVKLRHDPWTIVRLAFSISLFIYSLFSSSVAISYYKRQEAGWLVNNELEIMWKEVVVS